MDSIDMTIESSGLSNKFHFDLTARYSRSVTRESSFQGQSNVNNNSRIENFYSRSNPVSLIEKTLSDSLGKRIDIESNNRFESPARNIAKNVLSFVRQELREARSNGASEQELQTILNKAAEGIQKGFDEAKDILQSRFESNPRLERQIERAFNRIQRGLERLDNRFAPNVDALTTQQNANLSQANNSISDTGAPSEQQVVAAQVADIQSRQIEFTKTRNVERSRSFELSIQTQEGDTVNLSIQKSVSKQFSKEATFNDEGFTINIDRQIQREKQVSYQVSGDINEQEQAAIDALVKKIDRLADKFYSGNLAGAFQKATRIGIDAEQLANFSLNLQSSRSVEVTKTYREVQGIPAAQQTPSPVEAIGEFVGGVAEIAEDDVVNGVIADPVPVATELFKQISVRDERYAQLILEQSVEVIDKVIEDIAGLAQEQLQQAA